MLRMFHSLPPPCVACCRNLCKTGASIRDQACAVIHVFQVAKVGAHSTRSISQKPRRGLAQGYAVERCDPTTDNGYRRVLTEVPR